MGVVKLAIMGAGPKAAAIVAKASVINSIQASNKRRIEFKIDVFDPRGIGANWQGGDAGYSDGEQPLCTPIERDLGFPYLSELKNRIDKMQFKSQSRSEVIESAVKGLTAGEAPSASVNIDQELAQRFSWQAFKVSNGSFHDWVNRGRKPPSHREFVSYLKWSFNASEKEIITEEIVGLTPKHGQWIVHAKKSDSNQEKSHSAYAGVIITGPGPSSRRFETDATKHRMFNGDDFWTRRTEVEDLLKNRQASVVVLGGGGTGAAILSWMARKGFTWCPITLVGSQATVYARIDNAFENRLFSSNDLWQRLTRENKVAFFDRINRGVVWSNVLHDVEGFEQFDVVDGLASSVRLLGDDLAVHIKGRSKPVTATLVIDATGFNAWHFMDLIRHPFIRPSTKEEKEAIKEKMAENLTLRFGRSRLPPLHAPGLSDFLGPGLGSLMSLGAMSDRILGAYLPP